MVRGKLRYLSSNIVDIIEELAKNQRLKKLLNYNDKTPISNETVTSNLLLDKIFPYPFDINHKDSQLSNLMVYFDEVALDGKAVEKMALYIDVIVHKELYLINDENGKPILRPYEIVREVVDTLEDRTIKTVGTINVVDVAHQTVNDQFEAHQILAEVTAYNLKK